MALLSWSFALRGFFPPWSLTEFTPFCHSIHSSSALHIREFSVVVLYLVPAAIVSPIVIIVINICILLMQVRWEPQSFFLTSNILRCAWYKCHHSDIRSLKMQTCMVHWPKSDSRVCPLDLKPLWCLPACSREFVFTGWFLHGCCWKRVGPVWGSCFLKHTVFGKPRFLKR